MRRTYNNLAIMLGENNQVDEAFEVLHKCIEVNPKDASAYNNLGNALEAANRPAEDCRGLQ